MSKPGDAVLVNIDYDLARLLLAVDRVEEPGGFLADGIKAERVGDNVRLSVRRSGLLVMAEGFGSTISKDWPEGKAFTFYGPLALHEYVQRAPLTMYTDDGDRFEPELPDWLTPAVLTILGMGLDAKYPAQPAFIHWYIGSDRRDADDDHAGVLARGELQWTNDWQPGPFPAQLTEAKAAPVPGPMTLNPHYLAALATPGWPMTFRALDNRAVEVTFPTQPTVRAWLMEIDMAALSEVIKDE